MNCPRCGTPNEPGDRFCSSCGGMLKKAEAAERRTLRERAAQLVGTTPRARAISIATVTAIAIAVGAFIALEPAGDDTIPRDAYTIAADRICLDAKRQIVAAERRSLSQPGRGETSDLAQVLLPIVASWRSSFQALAVPADRTEEAGGLDIALRDVEIELGKLARPAGPGEQRQTVAQAKQADEATTRAEEAISSLGLSRCERATIGFSPDPS